MPSWIKPAIIPKGGKILFGGEAKIGKSWVLENIVRAIIYKEPLFGIPEFQTESCIPLLFDGELSEPGLALRGKKVFADKILANDLKPLDNFHYISKEIGVKVDTTEGRSLINREIARTKANIVIFDPISKFHHYDENVNTELITMFDWFDELLYTFRSQELSILYSHHFGKPPGNKDHARSILDPYNFRGGSKFKDEADTLITAARINPKNTRNTWDWWYIPMRFTLRHAEEPDDIKLTFNKSNDGRVKFDSKFMEET